MTDQVKDAMEYIKLNKQLHAAIDANDSITTKYLLENGASSSSFDEFLNNTALYKAARNGSPEIIEILVEFGANLHEHNNQALQVAASYGNNETYKYIQNKLENADLNNSYKSSCSTGNIELLKYIDSKKDNINHQNAFTAACGCKKNNVQVINYLKEKISNKAEVATNEKNINQAVFSGNTIAIDFLLENGANQDLMLRESAQVAEQPSGNDIAIKHLLIDRKVEITPQTKEWMIDKGYKTALELANKAEFHKRIENKLKEKEITSFSMEKPRQGLAKKMKSQGMKL